MRLDRIERRIDLSTEDLSECGGAGMGGRRSHRPGGRSTISLLVPLIVASNLALIEGASAQTGPPDEPSRQELPDERTATSRTFRNPDGSFTTQFFTAPINYEQHGEWRPISSDLIPAGQPGYAWRNAANSFDVFFKDSLGTGFMRFGVGADDFALSLQAAAAVAGQRGGAGEPASRVAYPGVFPSVDLQYDVLATGVKETVVLADASTPTHYRFVLTPPQGVPVDAREQPDGSRASPRTVRIASRSSAIGCTSVRITTTNGGPL